MTGKRTGMIIMGRPSSRQWLDHRRLALTAIAAGRAPEMVPATGVLGGRPHEWYPLTEGPVIDLGALPAGQAVAAAVARLLRLGGGGQVALQWPGNTGADRGAIQRSCARAGPLRGGSPALCPRIPRPAVRDRRPAPVPCHAGPPYLPAEIFYMMNLVLTIRYWEALLGGGPRILMAAKSPASLPAPARTGE